MKGKAPVKTQGRWTSVCIAMDFKTDQIEFYAEGKNFTGKSGGLRSLNAFMSNNTDLPMVIR